jgi:hypothetical protein
VASGEQNNRKKKVEEFKQAHQKSEIQLLKKLIDVPKQLDPSYSEKVCSYQIVIE